MLMKTMQSAKFRLLETLQKKICNFFKESGKEIYMGDRKRERKGRERTFID